HAAETLQFQPLHARDVPALLQTPQARPLIVEIWSLDCSYCRENIARIAQWRRTAKKNVDVVMVSMDGPEQAEMLNRALAPLA
ncbi:redoxin domain-containing protein, partial [Escherichia fergusonii]|uniref:redoxin domain-containing protein n=1 Tax=Escherichia fergusonii TaxID=564 RepID=UPI001CBE78BD